MDKNHYVIKSLYLARFLINNGYELKKVKINKFNPAHNVFLFENTENLHKAIKDYSNIRATQKTKGE